MGWIKYLFKVFSWIANNVKIMNSNYPNPNDRNHETRVNPAYWINNGEWGLDVGDNPVSSNLSDWHRRHQHN